MPKTHLQHSEVRSWIKKNTYSIKPSKKFISRCIDGRYENAPDLPALAIPGGDAGQLAILFATANRQKIKLDYMKSWKAICKVVGGKQNIRFHTDSHAPKKKIAGGCGHIKLKSLNPKLYGLKTSQVTFIKKCCKEALSKHKFIQVKLNGDHKEGAVLTINGNYGVYPQFKGKQLFIVHLSLINSRHKELAKVLVKTKAVQLHAGQTVKYLHKALYETHGKHLMLTAKALANGLPIFNVTFKTRSSFKVEKAGKVA